MSIKHALLNALDQAYDRQSWHGTNLRGSLRGLTPAEASRRPGPGRHNIWELVVHCAYWKYAVWRRLTGAKRGSFPLDGSNFFRRPLAVTDEAWQSDLRLLQAMHDPLRAVVADLDDADFARPVKGSRLTHADLVSGITAHDLYHAGQVQLIKTLKGMKGRQRRGA
jgi:hypothetical protein